MKRQILLEKCVPNGIRSLRSWGLMTIIVLALGLLLIPAGHTTWAARLLSSSDTSLSNQEAIAARQQKADEYLDAASAQLKRHQYQQCQESLEKCQEFYDILTASQIMRLEQYDREAANGFDVVNRANQALMAGSEHLQANRVAEAQRQFDTAYALRKQLPEEIVDEINAQINGLKNAKAQQKKDMKSLFLTSRKNYKQGNLDEARTGFEQINQSGIELNWFDRSLDLVSVDGYLRGTNNSAAR